MRITEYNDGLTTLGRPLTILGATKEFEKKMHETIEKSLKSIFPDKIPNTGEYLQLEFDSFKLVNSTTLKLKTAPEQIEYDNGCDEQMFHSDFEEYQLSKRRYFNHEILIKFVWDSSTFSAYRFPL